MLFEYVDNCVIYLGFCFYLVDVLCVGVKVYFYKKGFLYFKLMVLDDMFLIVGFINFDFCSFEYNFEVNVFMYDMEIVL